MSEKLARFIHETQERLFLQTGMRKPNEAFSFNKYTDQEKRVLIAIADQVEMEFFRGNKEEGLPSEFFCESGYGHNTKQPFVALSYNGRMIAQMPPETAQELAMNLITAAEGSLSDAFLIEFFRDVIKTDEGRIGYVVMEFRKFRDERDERNQQNA